MVVGWGTGKSYQGTGKVVGATSAFARTSEKLKVKSRRGEWPFAPTSEKLKVKS
ncbi:hypothetical protein H6G72_03315 [Planktothricoides sp. FACHB-1370]|uniref:Uncharacterized protein n=1 Tax=Planktothricoides raciborskii FACHB-1370 TaxID=2949576 RepID=A0ABR8E8W5_9CYAN|nr:hypothetical protein [Planktothricoides sp. SR001]MBD2542900.1 hypothetical protein [Planktothricoides raciborskii FACHB-1370]MBD2581776.1 hypothetical protein [Planktothricoides raciborskii FACHB-1261]